MGKVVQSSFIASLGMALWVMLRLSLPAQVPDAFDTLAQHIRTANVQAVGAQLAPQADIAILDKEALYNKTQAEMVLRGFFAKYPCKTFIIKHRGGSTDGTRFAIGVYQPTNSPALRTYIVTRSVGSTTQLEELRFELQ